ncbi:MAG: FAD-dependent oxidoreductase, partial [Thermohalobaculum sp.]|nr:FAD-dependent oxidoreductase [Thermohalobaculum sp.]
MPSSDIVVLGGGTNGLAAATRLAQAGRSVTLLEAAEACGGGALGWEFAPGWRSPGLAHLAHLLDPRVVAGMDLARHGLTLGPPLATVALAAGGPALRLDAAGAAEGPDRAAWAALRQRLMAYAARLAPLRAIAPPRLSRRADNDFATLLGVALGLRRLGA